MPILRQNFQEVTRGFSERDVEGDCDTEFTGGITESASSPFTIPLYEVSTFHIGLFLSLRSTLKNGLA